MNKQTKKNKLTLGSLFDGSGGFPLGGLLAGITPIWSSEIEPFPVRVTTKRFPDMKHYGDISALNGADLPPVDIITFGSPCQDMSVAGKRSGLDGSRSSLFYEAIRIIKEMRGATDGKHPRYIVWENVPGAFSSNKGQDFKAVLEEVCKVKDAEVSIPFPEKWENAGRIMGNGYSAAWRQFDAQFWGVPQRRKRIYLVADFAGESAGKILFESEGLSGYSQESFRAWQRAANGSERGIGEAGNGKTADYAGQICLNDQGGKRMDVTEEVTSTLRAESHHPPLVFENHSQDSRYTGPLEKSQTVLSTFRMGGNNQPLVVEEESGNSEKTENVDNYVKGVDRNRKTVDKIETKCYGVCSKSSHSMLSDNPCSGFYEASTSRTLDRNANNPSCAQGGLCICEPMAFAQNQRNETRELKGKVGCLAAESGMKQQTFVLQGSMIGRKDENGPKGSGVNEDVCFTLDAADRHAVCTLGSSLLNSENVYAMTTGNYMQVERDITPTLMARDYKDPAAICYGIGRDTFNQGRNAKFASSYEKELQPTMTARGPGAVQRGYTVRRLTPTECARLQGFPDWWCDDLGTEQPTEEEIQFWEDVFETHRRLVTQAKKPKTRNQICKWLKNPYSDSAEYKMWGNGVALPNVFFVLSGIVWADSVL